MGLPPFKDCPASPSPCRFTVLRAVTVSGATVAEVHYPDATNCEGRKILVLEGEWSARDLDALASLDPHFSDSATSPLARFNPAKDGLAKALSFARNLF